MKAVPNRPRRSAATAVETAFVLMLMLLFIFGIIEYCRYLLAVQLATNAARTGLRLALTAAWITDNDPQVSGAKTYVDFNNSTDTNKNCTSIQTAALNTMGGMDKALFTKPSTSNPGPAQPGVDTNLFISDKYGGPDSAGNSAPTATPYPPYPQTVGTPSNALGPGYGSWESAVSSTGSATSGTAIDYPIYLTFTLSGSYKPILPNLLGMNATIPVNILVVGIAENND